MRVSGPVPATQSESVGLSPRLRKDHEMNYQEVLENAKGQIGPYCKACTVCSGHACRNQIPGPGAKGSGDTAIRNYEKWQEIRVNMDTIGGCNAADTSAEFFGKTFT